MKINDFVFILGFAGFEFGLWQWDYTLALTIGGTILMFLALVDKIAYNSRNEPGEKSDV